MKKFLHSSALWLVALCLNNTMLFAGTTTADFKIEGLITPASPKALIAGLEKQLVVKVLKLDLKTTDSGWPVLTVEFDSSAVSLEKIEAAISEIEDPAGHQYKVHHGPLVAGVNGDNAPLTEEEIQAIAKLGPIGETFPPLENPMTDKVASASRGKPLFEKNCAKCHGLNGNGYGTVAQGITTWPRQLWAWNNAGPEADGYLFWFITNGRTDMPPWGVILTEEQRWDLVSYIKTLKAPAN
jgi:mono/diheme cytochrome c family protein